MPQMAGVHECWVKSRTKLVKPSPMCSQGTWTRALWGLRTAVCCSLWRNLWCAVASEDPHTLTHLVESQQPNSCALRDPSGVRSRETCRCLVLICCWSLLLRAIHSVRTSQPLSLPVPSVQLSTHPTLKSPFSALLSLTPQCQPLLFQMFFLFTCSQIKRILSSQPVNYTIVYLSVFYWHVWIHESMALTHLK